MSEKFKVWTMSIVVDRIGGPDNARLHFRTRGGAIDMLADARRDGGFCISIEAPERVVFWPMSRIYSVIITPGESDTEGM